jgi:hypothetical protein
MTFHGSIYKITNTITDKIYIGQTCLNSVEDRFKAHISCAKRLKNNKGKIKDIYHSYLYNAMVLHGYTNFAIEEIDTANSQFELDELEKDYISIYDSLAPNGYNLKTGGNSNGKHSQVTIELMKKQKTKTIDSIRNEQIIGMPPYVKYIRKRDSETIAINNHPLCKYKAFSTLTYKSLELAKESLLKFLEELEKNNKPYSKTKNGGNHLPPGLNKIINGYRVNKVYKGTTFDRKFSDKSLSDKQNFDNALKWYNNLINNHN